MRRPFAVDGFEAEVLEPFDKSRCSFPVPAFASGEEEDNWVAALTPEQRLELLHLVQIARWGEELLHRGMDRSAAEVLTMDEFIRMKEAEDAAEVEWRRANGWPPRFHRR